MTIPATEDASGPRRGFKRAIGVLDGTIVGDAMVLGLWSYCWTRSCHEIGLDRTAGSCFECDCNGNSRRLNWRGGNADAHLTLANAIMKLGIVKRELQPGIDELMMPLPALQSWIWQTLIGCFLFSFNNLYDWSH